MGILDWLMAFITKLVENRIVLAVVVGLVFALAVTQWLKFVLLKTKWLPDPDKWILQAAALPIGAVPTAVVLPHEMEFLIRCLIGVVVGASAPYAYNLIQAMLWKVAPSVAEKLSVNPYKEDGK